MQQHELVLNSWKEISSYVGRGVRTVQRWEANAGFPIHRPGGHLKSSVFALKNEVDAWFKACASGQVTKPRLPETEVHAKALRFKRNVERFEEISSALQEQISALQGSLDRTITLRQNLRFRQQKSL